MKNKHTVCQYYSDVVLMKSKMQGTSENLCATLEDVITTRTKMGTHPVGYNPIPSNGLSVRLKRQGVPRSLYRRNIKSYMKAIYRRYGYCCVCRYFIGKYPTTI